MNKYKHGNWFCKPANEAEAKEIMDRAVASGAEMHTRWSPDDKAFGVFEGYVSWDDEIGKRYTIEELRQKFPLTGELASVESKSSYAKLQYPLGTPIEVRMNGIWHQATVHGQAGDYIIARADGYWYDEYAAKDVRPLRTEREKWIEAASNGLSGDMETLKYADEIAGQIYDAIKSGALKAPEAE